MAMILTLQDKNRLGEYKYNLTNLEPGILPAAAGMSMIGIASIEY